MTGTQHAGCPCCAVPTAIFGPRRSFNDLPTSRIVCDLCAKHQGSDVHDLRRKNATHIDMWIEYAREAVETAEARKDSVIAGRDKTIAEYNEQVAKLQQELDERPVRIVTENLDLERVREAQDKAEAAYRSRDQAYLRLTMVHMLHFERSSGRCRCGKQSDVCDIAQIVDTWRPLKVWERIQTERRRDRQAHMLPFDHPGIVDARWDPDENESREFEAWPD